MVGAPPPEAPADAPPDRFWGTRNLRSDRPNELKGNAASAGVARGPARVLATLDEARRFQPGDVLVTRTTMPPWTPLFAVASAVITETGGILSHAAVTAREYGLPAVLCVENATRLIKDGQPLEVDGSNGTVRILS
jgi:pyruvate,water dikinase